MSNELASLGRSFGLDTSDKYSGKTQLALQREGNEIIKDLILAGVREQGRAMLTKTALDNVGSLSALEAYLSEIAPTGRARYKHLIDIYAMRAANSIARW